jgi:hypothetical protein
MLIPMIVSACLKTEATAVAASADADILMSRVRVHLPEMVRNVYRRLCFLSLC